MLLKFDFISVIQTSAQIKIQEAWKASRDPNFPINFGSKGREGEREKQKEQLERQQEEKGRKEKRWKERKRKK